MVFPNSMITEEEKYFPDKPRMRFTIPFDSFQCKIYCCTTSTVPPWVWNAITIHKSQGIIIGSDKDWENVVIDLLGKHRRYHPGTELVDFSWATSRESSALCFEDVNEVTIEDIKTIGRGKGYDERRRIECKLGGLAEKSKHPLFQKWLLFA